jgi:hypothetical protein
MEFAAAHREDQRWRRGLFAQQPEHRAGEVAFERAACFQAALAGLLFRLEVGADAWVAAASDDRDVV